MHVGSRRHRPQRHDEPGEHRDRADRLPVDRSRSRVPGRCPHRLFNASRPAMGRRVSRSPPTTPACKRRCGAPRRRPSAEQPPPAPSPPTPTTSRGRLGRCHDRGDHDRLLQPVRREVTDPETKLASLQDAALLRSTFLESFERTRSIGADQGSPRQRDRGRRRPRGRDLHPAPGGCGGARPPSRCSSTPGRPVARHPPHILRGEHAGGGRDPRVVPVVAVI